MEDFKLVLLILYQAILFKKPAKNRIIFQNLHKACTKANLLKLAIHDTIFISFINYVQDPA